MAYPKDSTIASQMSEYDNVPHMSNYYIQNAENPRRVFDPTYELHQTDPSRGNPAGLTSPAKKSSSNPTSPITSQNESKRNSASQNMEIPRVVPNSYIIEARRAHRFPNPDSQRRHKDENGLEEYYHQKNTSLGKQVKKERQRVIPKVRPIETFHPDDWNSERKMARVPSFFFYFLVFLAEILLFGVLILSLVWVQFYQGGFAWTEDPAREFNLHPVLMITGFIFLMGHAMLVYRLFGCCNKLGAKLLHTILYLMAVPCIVVSMIAVFDSHDLRENPIPNLYSLHSWIGLVTIGLFGLQLVVGFFSFWMLLLCEQGTSSFRAAMVPIHSSFGLITFMLAIATCVTGLTEKAFFSLKNYSDLPDEAYYYNAMAMALTALAIIMGYVLHNPKYQAPSPVAFVEGPSSNSHYVMTQHGYVYREKNI